MHFGDDPVDYNVYQAGIEGVFLCQDLADFFVDHRGPRLDGTFKGGRYWEGWPETVEGNCFGIFGWPYPSPPPRHPQHARKKHIQPPCTATERSSGTAPIRAPEVIGISDDDDDKDDDDDDVCVWE